MSRANRAIATLLTSLVFGMIPDAYGARPCGDADNNGTVSVTDGVNVLRSAASLSSIATRDCCDMDFNGVVSVTDGVLTLRAAADLPGATCLEEQIRDGLTRFGPITKIGNVVTAKTERGAQIAQTLPCSGGGFTITEIDRLEDVECREGDVITTGIITLSDAPLSATFASFQAVNVLTGETLVSSGTVEFREEATGTSAIGVIARESRASTPPPTGSPDRVARGTFTDELRDVRIDDEGRVLSGSILTTVAMGQGPFTSVRFIESFFAGTSLTIALVDFVNAPQAVGIVAEDALELCETCDSNVDCNEPLICLPCSTDCQTSSPRRCTVNFMNFAARCEDGLY
jgi:hypothetical protein